MKFRLVIRRKLRRGALPLGLQASGTRAAHARQYIRAKVQPFPLGA